MAKYRGVARDEFGNALSGASVTVYDFETTTESTIYSDSELATTQANPITVGDDGVFVFYAEPGYYDIAVAKSGYTTVTLEDEVLGSVMAYCQGANTGSDSIDATPVVIGNTNLGAAHLVEQYEALGFTIDVDAGTFTYNGIPTIQAEVLGRVSFITPLGTTSGILMAYRDYGGARALEVGIDSIASHLTENRVVQVAGIVELQTNDVLEFLFQTTAGGGEIINFLRGSYYSVKSLG